MSIAAMKQTATGPLAPAPVVLEEDVDDDEADKVDLDWSAVIKRTFEAFIRGERPNMYGEWIEWRTT